MKTVRRRGSTHWGAGLLAAALALAFASDAGAVTSSKPKKPPVLVTGVATGNVLLQADQVIYDTHTEIATAQGHVEIANDQRILMADSVVYDQTTDLVTATGHVSLLEADGTVLFGNKAVLTKAMTDGVVAGFAALIGKDGRFIAITGEKRQGRYLIGHHGVFTPCKICAKDPVPLWQVHAVRIVHDNVEKDIVYHDATFEFMGVPIFYTPYFSQSDPSVKHASGFLIPAVGGSTFLGTFVRIPYYVALSDSQDFTIEPEFSTEGGTLVRGEYRQRWGVGGMWLQGSLGYNPNAPQGQGPWESELFGSGHTPIDGTWSTGFDVQLTSNDTLLRRYDISSQDRLNSDLYVEGIDGRSRFAATGYFFQGLRPTDIAGNIPIALPLLEYTYLPDRKWLGGQFRFDASGLALSRSYGENDERASVSTSWTRPITTANGQVITFEALARGDVYHTDDAVCDAAHPTRECDPDATVDTQTLTRTVALGMIEWRWPFVASSASGKTNFIIEPITQVIIAPYGGNPKGIPNEDSTSFEFNTSNLFRVDPLPGLDLWEDGPHINAGLHGSAILPTGDMEVLVGEDFRLKPENALPPNLGLGGTRSDIVGQIKIDFSPYIDLTHEVRINQDNGSIESNQLDIKARLGRSFLDLTYLTLPPEDLGTGLPQPRQEINVAASIAVYGNWFVFASAIRDLEQSEMRDARLGLTYQDECFLLSLGFRRQYTNVLGLPPSSSVIFRVGLLTNAEEKVTTLP